MKSLKIVVGLVAFTGLAIGAYQWIEIQKASAQTQDKGASLSGFDAVIQNSSERMMKEGQQIFRFETFDDQTYWGDALGLHQAIEGA